MGYDLIIVGAGIAGSFAAYGAVKENLKAIVYEASHGPNGATTRSGGIVTRLLDNRIDAELADKSIKLFREILGREYHEVVREGFLCVEDIDEAIVDLNKFKGLIPDLELIDRWSAVERWPYLKLYDEEAVLYSPSDITIEPDKAIHVIWNRIANRGVEIMSGCRVRRLIFDNGAVQGVEIDEGTVRSDNVVLAMGPWNREFLSKHGIFLESWLLGVPLYRFQVNNTDIIGIWDEVKYTYWRPSIGGTFVGGAYDAFPIINADEGFSRPPRPSLENITRLFRYRFSFEEWKLFDSWSGPISLYRKYRPFIGEIGGIKGLYIIEGLAGYGLVRGPAKAVELINYIAKGVIHDRG